MAETRIREASCCCGALTIKLSGDPEYVSSCACQACQRRTGSAFGVTAFFQEEHVVGQWGEATVFERLGASGKPLFFRFCPACGSTVWWEALARPGRIAVAAGAFADKDFPAPQRLIWADYKASWVEPPAGAAEFPRSP
ncbi:MAG: aldehyde-activating protein [Phenylobacterium sp.]|jgi:hypothetical protein|nr:aldehyde-activating protein [Phenylobacterium sp.]